MAISPDYGRVYEKLWLAHAIHEASWDQKRYRLFSEDAVDHLLSAHDRETTAWWQYDRLLGRSPEGEFWAFVRAELAITDQNQLERTRELWQRWRNPKILGYMKDWLERTHKLVVWPEWAQDEGENVLG